MYKVVKSLDNKVIGLFKVESESTAIEIPSSIFTKENTIDFRLIIRQEITSQNLFILHLQTPNRLDNSTYSHLQWLAIVISGFLNWFTIFIVNDW